MTSDRVSLLALLRVPGVSWSFVAREASRPDGLDRLLVGASDERSRDATESMTVISDRLGRLERLREEAAEIIESTSKEGIRLTTVLEEDYPLNLRTIFNLPPFLFYRGTLRSDDARAVAVVGTRQASELGLERARKMGRLLAEQEPPFKYENKSGWRDIFARVLVGFLDKHPSTFEDFDVIVASPTYLPEDSPRQYDHTRAVIDAAEQEGGDRWPFDVGDPPVIIKTADSPRMTGLSWAKRNRVARGPLRDALVVPEPGLVRRRSVLVYDDVFTDGQTLNEVARALRACGASEVCGVTLTRQPYRG